jgi:hypothetical protein
MSEINFFKQANTEIPIFGSSGDSQNPPLDNSWNDWMKSEFDSTSPMPLISGNLFVFGGVNFGYLVKLDRSKPRANSNGKYIIRDERRSGLSGITTQQRFFFRYSVYFPSNQFSFPNDNREYIVLYQHGVSSANPRLYIRVAHNGQFYIQCEEIAEGITYRHFVGSATLDILHTFVIEVNWGSDNNGYINVWKDSPVDFAPMYNSSGELTINEGVSGKFTFLKRENEDFSRFNRVGKNISEGTVLAQRFTQIGAYVPNPSLPWNSDNPSDPDNLIFTPTYREFYVSGLSWLIPEPEWNRQDIVNFMFEVDPTIPPDPTEGFRARLRFPSEPTV